MAQGGIDHPSYITRQMWDIGPLTASSAGTSGRTVFPCTVRIRNIVGVIQAAGTTSSAQFITIQTGTTSVGTITTGTLALNAIASSGDLNVTINNGTSLANILNFVNPSDGTVVARLTAEGYLDPSATWTGQN